MTTAGPFVPNAADAWRLLTPTNIQTRRLWPWSSSLQKFIDLGEPRPRRSANLLIASDYGGEHPQATHNIYGQQYQMGRFLHAHFEGRPVVLNDIGAATYLADIHLLDIWGLGTLATAASALDRTYNSNHVEQLAAASGADLAIVYDFAVRDLGFVPHGWQKRGQWTIDNNIVGAGDTVVFYAVTRAGQPLVGEALTAFSPDLPPDVAQWRRPDGE